MKKVNNVKMFAEKTDFLKKEKSVFFCRTVIVDRCRAVIVHTLLSREVFWHIHAKIPRHASQNSIAAGNLE